MRRLLNAGLVIATLLGPILTALPTSAAEGPTERPNVVFLYTDDQAQWALGAYGNKEIHTPNLDRLAQTGALFRNAFTVTPVCSPSRASMLTSRYSTQFGIADWIDPKIEPDLGLAPSAILWPELLKAQGYATALMGKWHLGTRPEFHPTRQGFDRFYGFLGGGNQPINPELEVEGKVQRVEGSLPDLLVGQGIRFVEANRDRPFLLSIHFRAPHVPYAPVPEQDSAHYDTLDPTIPDVPGLPRQRVKMLTKRYYASVSSVDRNVGRLLDRLETLGLTGKTIVIFTSDHGYMIGHHGLWHKGNGSWIMEGKQGRRPNMFDNSIRVPLIVRWPGVVAPGTTIDRVVSNLDLFPSIVEMTGSGVPDNLRIGGRSFVPLLREPNNTSIPWDDTLYGQYDMHNGQVANMRLIRTPEWKLIRHFEPGVEDELFHLTDDPGETRNLAGDPAHRDRKAELAQQLKQWMISTGDPRGSNESTAH
ncbi:sulfatase-like hydrolase/transferase [Singulisphaera sp. Ch08]|uniref:Sulfatase-like hydrolase/transferase n=1 Tax=Singulisphaera sp. Ch08 TaxID=3120278 RepID=A0AAU7C9I9_9BACT